MGLVLSVCLMSKEKKELKEKLEKTLMLLADMVEQADEDTPGDYRTKHFRTVMDESIEWLVTCKIYADTQKIE